MEIATERRWEGRRGELVQPQVVIDLFGKAPEHIQSKLAREVLAGKAAARAGARTPQIGVDPATIAEDMRRAKLEARLAAWATTAPPDYAGARLDCLSPDQHPETLRRWLWSNSRTLWLVGNTGAGKTYAGWGLLHAGIGRDYLVRGWEHNDYLAQLRPGGSTLEPWQIRKRAQEAHLELLDDFGAEMEPRPGEDVEEATEFARRETIMLLNHRLGAGKRQIISTNLTADVLEKLFKDRIISRLRQDCVVVAFDGPDRRQAYASW